MQAISRAAALHNARTVLSHCVKQNRFDALILDKLSVDEIERPGVVKCTMPVERNHLNLTGTLHGGVSATLVDIVGSLAIAAAGLESTGVSTDIQVSYLAAPKPGEQLVIRGFADKVGKTLAFTRVEIATLRDGHDQETLAVRGSHTKFVRGIQRMANNE
ncbi:hypothetical protein GGF31_005427 [Allomyces arbusculus]|nr:hypothetical protein GGF31_005427 [Allomyces arbusculus]